MAGFSELKKGMSTIAAMERELNLKQLQINRLLNITQAINNNVSAKELFHMYKSFLSWEVGVKKMALYIRENESWRCATHVGISEELLKYPLEEELLQYTRLMNLEGHEHPLIQEFDVIIPVRHKDIPIAYVLIGGFSDDEDMYSKVQFITTITNVIAVAIENKRLFKRQLEQERLKREMELASEMQHMLIPKKLPSKQRYELASIYKPHLGVGGDYFDYIEFPDGKLVFCVGDISGKGVAAALLMANFQANFHTLINKRAKLDEFIRDLNHSVNLITGGDRFITFFIAEYDPQTQHIQYVNAGHNPPVVINQGEIKLLETGCTMLGSFAKLPKVEIGKLQLDGDSMILCFTDGLTDLRNEAGEFLNEEMLHRFTSKNAHMSAKAFNDLLMERIERFKGQQIFPDDFTILTCRIFGQPPAGS